MRLGRLLGVAVALAVAGCYESEFPLDPVPRAPLDSALLGSWRCLPADPEPSDKAADIVVGRAREGVYVVSFREEGQESESYEAHASIVRGRPLLNIREVGPSSRKKWMFVRYTLLRPSILQVQLVNDQALKGVDESVSALRRAIERERDPKLFVDFCVCVRTKADKRS